MAPTLSDRQIQILHLSVALFIETAEPVSSRALARRFGLPYSPATIRNEMSDLEELGYLFQPHTSAGRIPTDAGYRSYVAALEQRGLGSEDEDRLSKIEREILTGYKDADELLQDAIQILSKVTALVAVAAFPGPASARFTSLHLVSVGSSQVLATLVTDSSHAEAHLVALDRPVPQDRLDLYSNLINERFAGRPLSEFLDGNWLAVRELESTYIATIERVLRDFSSRISVKSGRSDVMVTGASSVLAQPEFQDLQKVRAILEAFENRELLLRMLHGAKDQGSQITFVGVFEGAGGGALKDFSLVSSVYRAGGAARGAIGILGPRRMDYPRVIHYVNHVSESLSRVLDNKTR